VTQNASDARIQYTAAGGETTFDYDFNITDSSHIVVDVDDVILTEDTDYTVSGVGATTGGEISLIGSYSGGATADEVWTLYRSVPIARSSDYQTLGDFQASVVNDEEDQQIQIMQELRRDIDRSMVLAPSASDSVSTELPAPQADYTIGWDPAGTALENKLRQAGILSGSGAPAAGLGLDNDFYIDTTNDDIYGPKTSGAWGSATSLIGPTGATGPTGPAGADGVFAGTEATVTIANADKMALLDASDSFNPKYALWSAIKTAINTYISGLGYSSTPHTQGKHTIFIPAAAMRPTTSNGAAAINDVETTAGRPDITALDFDATADEHAQFQVALPKSYNLGTVTAQFWWESTAADTDGVTWAIQGVAVPDNSTIDVAYGTAVTVDDANQGAAEELLVSAESGPVTIAGTPADDDMCFFRVFRDVSDVNDIATEDARLIGVKLFITTDKGNDT